MAKPPIDLDGFGVTTGDLPDHYAAIGRLITAFGSVEIATHMSVMWLLNVGERRARLVTGAQRFQDNVRLARDLAAISDIKGKETFNRGLDQTNKLADIRNFVAHRAWTFRDREMWFHTAFTARKPVSGGDGVLFTIDYLNIVAEHAGNISAMLLHPFLPSNDYSFFGEHAEEAKASEQRALHAKFPEP